jgi:hypothetical protein
MLRKIACRVNMPFGRNNAPDLQGGGPRDASNSLVVG